MLTATELKKLKVVELKDMLQERGLDTKGVKEDLVNRLAEAMAGEEEAPVAEATGASKAPATAGGAEATTEQEPMPAAPTEAEPVGGTTDAAGPAAAVAAGGPPAAAAASGGVALSQAEKMRLRAERFGLPVKSGDGGEKKSAIGGVGFANMSEEIERRKKRAERFGLPVPVTEQVGRWCQKQNARQESELRARGHEAAWPGTCILQSMEQAQGPRSALQQSRWPWTKKWTKRDLPCFCVRPCRRRSSRSGSVPSGLAWRPRILSRRRR